MNGINSVPASKIIFFMTLFFWFDSSLIDLSVQMTITFQFHYIYFIKTFVKQLLGVKFAVRFLEVESVAQLVEHIPFKDGALGSNPSRFTKAVFPNCLFLLPFRLKTAVREAVKREHLQKSPYDLFNEYLKEIQDLCGIKTKLSTHVARHTCATMLLNKKVPVAKVLGYTSIRTTTA
jgi:hypothetical protein